jgi:hypothetical protein
MSKHTKLHEYELIKWLLAFWHKSWWHKTVSILLITVIALMGAMYGIAEWYIHGENGKPLVIGTSFIPDYAASLGLNPQKTMDTLINDVGVKNFRLVSYWSDGEPTEGTYDFTQLDWQFQKADAAHAKVILTLGLRQPRWPECHAPGWADTSKPEATWYPQLKAYMSAVIERYKNNPALQSYQLENEYFLKGFGTCTNFDRSRLVDEYKSVKKLDPSHQIIVPRSNNAIGTPIGQPTPDEFSISIYKRVWDAAITHRYLEYPFPSWFYAFVAGTQKIVTGKDMIIGELQGEAWPPNGKNIPDVSLAEQNKSLDAKRLNDRFSYAEKTGMKGIYLWGGEYWVYRDRILHDPSLLNVAKAQYNKTK